LDWVIMEHCDAIFSKKYKCNPIQNAKAQFKLREACEKCKKTLSVNLDASINVDCLMEDEDLHVNLKRADFEEMAAAVFER